MKTKMLQISLLFCLHIFFSCGNNIENEDTSIITQETTSLLPMQVSYIYIKNGIFDSEQYAATFSNNTITLNKLNDTTLFFLTPIFTKGSYYLTFELKSKHKSLQYNILDSEPIGDKKAYVTNYINTNLVQIDSALTDIIMDTTIMSQGIKEFTDYYIQKSKSNISNLSEDELNQFALFLQSNKERVKMKSPQIFSEALEERANNYANSYVYYVRSQYEIIEKMRNANILTFFTIYPAKYIHYFLKALKLKALLSTTLTIMKIDFTKLNLGFSSLGVKSQNNLQKVITSSSETELTFLNDQTTTLVANSVYRNINSEDLYSTQSSTQKVVRCYDDFKSAVNTANSKLFKEKPAQLPGNLSEVKVITGNRDIHTNYLTISDISNSKVKLVSFEKSGYELKLRFKTDEPTDQTFTFNLNYSNPGFVNASKKFEAKLSISRFGSFTDSRDGQVYKTITIGSQTWMAENLAYLPVTPTWPYEVGSEDYGNEKKLLYYTKNLDKYGVCYNWSAAITAAPAGWHIPSTLEWETLSNYLGGYLVAGGKMKSTTGWNTPNLEASNSSEFNVLASGYRFSGLSWDNLTGPTGLYYGEGMEANFWSSTLHYSTNGELFPETVGLDYRVGSLWFTNKSRHHALYIRCIKDN